MNAQARAGEVLAAAGLSFDHVVSAQLLLHRPDGHGDIDLPPLNDIYAGKGSYLLYCVRCGWFRPTQVARKRAEIYRIPHMICAPTKAVLGPRHEVDRD